MSKSHLPNMENWQHHPARGELSQPTSSHTQIFVPQTRDLVACQLRHGERHYVRSRDLPGLLHLFPAEVRQLDQQSEKHVLERLRKALRAERIRGISGHWRYSLARHIGLAQAIKAEEQLLLK